MAIYYALTADGLRRWYGDLHALGGFDLAVPPGVIHGLLGPNGAGKTTASTAGGRAWPVSTSAPGYRLDRHAQRWCAP